MAFKNVSNSTFTNDEQILPFTEITVSFILLHTAYAHKNEFRQLPPLGSNYIEPPDPLWWWCNENSVKRYIILKNIQTVHALNHEVTQCRVSASTFFCDDNKIMQIKTAWDDCRISVAWFTEQNLSSPVFSSNNGVKPKRYLSMQPMMFPLRLKYYINITCKNQHCLPQYSTEPNKSQLPCPAKVLLIIAHKRRFRRSYQRDGMLLWK